MRDKSELSLKVRKTIDSALKEWHVDIRRRRENDEH